MGDVRGGRQGAGERDQGQHRPGVDHARTRCTDRRAWARCMSAAGIRACKLTAQMDGGGHERGMRSGTLNVPGIVGLGEACADRQRRWPRNRSAWLPARQAEESAAAELDEVLHQRHHGAPAAGQPEHQLRVRRRRILLMGINDIAVSSGSACTSATLEPSYVLKAWRGRRPGAFFHPLRLGPLQHGRRSGLRRRTR